MNGTEGMDDSISRRGFIRRAALGLGTAMSATLFVGRHADGALHEAAQADAETGRDACPLRAAREAATADLHRLVAPLAAGSTVGGLVIDMIEVNARGLGVVKITDARGRNWSAEICRRSADDANVRPLALTDRYALFLRNGGSGSDRTDEEIGVAVLALRDYVGRNEGSIGALALPSRKELWDSEGFMA